MKTKLIKSRPSISDRAVKSAIRLIDKLLEKRCKLWKTCPRYKLIRCSDVKYCRRACLVV